MKPTHKERAEAYVREQCPELMELSFGCEVQQVKTSARGLLVGTPENENGFGYWFNHEGTIYPLLEKHIEIIGHPIQLQHYLQVLDKEAHKQGITYKMMNCGVFKWGENKYIHFDLKTGQPEESSYQAFNQVVYGN